jgi:SAM-dependent methyltransferase
MTPRRGHGFDPVALRKAWDQQQQFHIPEREERFRVMLEVLEQTLPKRGRVLDLGCGTGSLSERILRHFPSVRSWAVDYDPVLLRVGREGLGSLGSRLTWVEADLRGRSWPRALPSGKFDAAVSTTALHWLAADELRALFRGLARLVRPGGVFLNGDGMPFDYGKAPRRHPRLGEIARAIRKRHAPKRRPKGVLDWDAWWALLERTPALRNELDERRRRYPHRHEIVPPPSADWQAAELRRAGFTEAGVVWQDMTDRVLLAVR